MARTWTASKCWQTDRVERDAGSSSGSSSSISNSSVASGAAALRRQQCLAALGSGGMACLVARLRCDASWPAWQVPSAFYMSTV